MPDLAVVLGTAGDRTDEAIYAMGALAALASDRLVVAGRINKVPGVLETTVKPPSTT